MNLRKVESYNLGLDIGTGSVGWAAVDEDGTLLRFKGRPAWGSRLYPDAETAETTRAKRGQRRRYDRRRQRLDLLQRLFAREMEKVDPEFFVRLNQSRLHPEDRDVSCRDYRWPLFNDAGFNEPDYYRDFPTIYHVRKWLLETDEKADIRLIYLAFHNIVKHRGNFLHQDNPSLSARNANMHDSIDRFCAALDAWCDDREIDCQPDDEKLIAAFEDASLSSGERFDAVKLALRFSREDKKTITEIAKAILGRKADFGKAFELDASDAKFRLSEEEKVLAFSCPDECKELFDAMRTVYSSFMLIGILNGANGDMLSACKVKEYDRYKRDLRLLKDLVRDYAPASYDEFFRGKMYEGTSDYDATAAKGYTRYNLGPAKLSYEDFIKEVKKLFAGTNASGDERYRQMEDSMEDGIFLRRLKTSDNGAIPFQLHLEEMDAIIDSQARYYPFLGQEKERIESLVRFRIPYYVGPLTQKNAARDESGSCRFAWSVRNPGMEDAKVFPWNWEEIIDRDSSAEAFICRMTGTCTYLQGEPVLPRHSLLYEMFCVLNELNGAKWTQDGDRWYPFDAEDRKGIVRDLFKKRKNGVTYKAVEDWLQRKHGLAGMKSVGGAYHVSGGQGETKFESRLSSYCEFCSLLGTDELTEEDISMAEEIVLWSTVFEDRDILKRKVKQRYGSRFDDRAVRRICNNRLSGWGRLSEKFLVGLKSSVDAVPHKMSIMDVLREGNQNNGKRLGASMTLMSILHDESYEFSEKIDEINRQRVSAEFSLSDMIGSPALRRGVLQALKIVDEVVHIAGKAPKHIFVEVARDESRGNKGRRTAKRYDALKVALGKLKGEYADICNELDGRSAKDLDDEKMLLYFSQCGKCMYSGKPLDPNRLSEYQVDHIIPQSYIKDDSLENKALVLSTENQRKGDSLLIDDAIRRRMKDHWKHLFDVGLIGKKKFGNLMRDCISENRMKGFINRQLVETSQMAKRVQEVLAMRYSESRVLPIKAGWSHQLRLECGFAKCREINDFHHAHDAYLACQMGRFILFRHHDVFDSPVKMAAVVRKFIKEEAASCVRNKKMPGSSEFIVSSFCTSGFDAETGEVFQDSWNAPAEIERMRKCLNYRDCYISRMVEETSGAFWDETIYSPRDASKGLKLPLKKGLDPKKYGSYSREQFAYFFVFEATKGAKAKCVIEFAQVPVHIAQALVSHDSLLDEYARKLCEESGLSFVKVLKRKVYKYQLITLGESRLYITGAKEVRNACQLAFTLYETELFSRIVNEGVFTETEVCTLFASLQEKLLRYAPRLAKQLKIADAFEEFVDASNEEKRAVLQSLASISAAHTNMVDLRAIGGVKNAGNMRISMSKELTNGTIEFIDQSVTGMFERRTKIEL